MDNERLAEMIAALIAERDELMQQANQRLAYLNGKVEALQELLAAGDEAGEPDDTLSV